MTASPKLIAVGDNCLDAFLNKDMLTVGGNALNVAVQWHRNGWDARYFGAVGPDREGEIVLQEIAAAGLSRDDVETLDGETAVTLLRDQFGDRTFLIESLGVGETYMPSQQNYAVIAAADWVHLGTNANPDLVRRLVADTVPFSIDVSTRPTALRLDGVPLVFASGPNEADADIEAVVEQLRSVGASKVVVTCGSHGSYFDDGETRYHAAATSVQVVDTCGAGDSFTAAFLAGLFFERLEPSLALENAAVRAGKTCTHLGGFPQQLLPIPDWLLTKYADIIARDSGS